MKLSPSSALAATLAVAPAFVAACGSAADVDAVAAADTQAIINGGTCAAGEEASAVAILVDGTINCPGQGSFDFTAVECTGGWCYVLDTQGHGLLAFRVRPLELVRRQYIAGRPVRMRLVHDLLAITLADGEVVWFATGSRPHRVPAPA